ncbi:acyl-CoA dehydrogenase family protein [Nocardia sp. CA-128927]|uniref:acyl-CoA dehydrogenase family protein n=1 Tax=Nocardia sp. CA-128927 TaxID=3239975 RepID=UPI003D9594D4
MSNRPSAEDRSFERKDETMEIADILQEVRKFVATELMRGDDSLDTYVEAPLPLYRKFRDTGLANWWIPPKYGGLGRNLQDSVDIVSELAYGDAGVSFTLFASILGSTMISLYGTDELRERYLRSSGDARGFSATLGSERAAGSELAKIATTATRDGEDLVLDGEKFFATNADFADFFVVIAASAENSLHQLAVVVPRETPGIHIRKRWGMIGLRSSATYQVSFENCRVPSKNMLQGQGVFLLEIALNATRILIAATAIGISRRIRDISIEYARSKTLQDSTLFEHPVFAGKIGQMEMQIDVMRNQCLAAAGEFDEIMTRQDAAAEFLRHGALRSALTAKVFCGLTGWDIAGVGSQMFGGLGYTNESIIGKLVRDVRYVSIVEGGEDVLHELVFRRYATPEFRRR